MHCRRNHLNPLIAHSLLGLLTPLLLTACAWPFRELLKPHNILQIYLLGVFFVALRFGLWSSVVNSITCAAAFAYFYAPPIFSIAIAEHDNMLGLAVMQVIGFITARLAASVRLQVQSTALRERRMSALYRLSKALSEGRSEQDIAVIGSRLISSEFSGKHALLLSDSNQPEPLSDEGWPDARHPPEIDQQIVDWVLQSAEAAGLDTAHFPEAKALYLPLVSSQGVIGVAVLETANPEQLAGDDYRQFVETFINQIAHALEKAYWLEQNKEAMLKIQSETLRNSLLSSISHDLRTPLATIVGAATTLESDDQRISGDQRKALVHTISHEAQRMSDLTIKILEMARLEAGSVRLNRQWYEAEEILGSALRRLDKTLKQRRIDIRIAATNPLIYADAALMQTLIVNLLDNAHKYSPAEQTIRVEIDSGAAGVALRIIDHGPGIPPGFEQRVFDKFFQLQPEGAQSGVGLGLSICKAIAQAHAGNIAVRNLPRGGAEFYVCLPYPNEAPVTQLDENQGAS